MMIVIVGSVVAVVLAIIITIALIAGRRNRPDERRRKTVMIAAALPFVRTTEPAFVDAACRPPAYPPPAYPPPAYPPPAYPPPAYPPPAYPPPAYQSPVYPPPTQPDVHVVAPHEPLDDDGPTTASPRHARQLAISSPAPQYPKRFARASSSVDPPIEGPTIRGPGIPPNRPEVRARDATVRAAIRANTLHATIKPKR